MRHANEILTGMAVLKDWLGDGMSPVDQATADRRSAACLTGNDGKECPNLKAPNWWQEHSTEPVALAIKEQLEKKSEMTLRTDLDLHPRMCGVCGCCMPLKVWTPIKHIAAHTDEQKAKEFVPYCWQRIELENGGLK